jgi:hypothetical protein
MPVDRAQAKVAGSVGRFKRILGKNMGGKKIMPAGSDISTGIVDSRISGLIAAPSFRSRRYLKS